MEANIYEHMPLKDENAVMLGKEVRNMVLSNAVVIPVIAVLQGIVALIGYLLSALKNPGSGLWLPVSRRCFPVVGDDAGLCAACYHLFCQRRYR